MTVCICACRLHVVDKACSCGRKEDCKSFVLISNFKESRFPVSRGQYTEPKKMLKTLFAERYNFGDSSKVHTCIQTWKSVELFRFKF